MTYKRKEVIGDAELYLGDCLEVLPTLGKVDAVIADPPYEKEAHTNSRRQATSGQDGGRVRKIEVLPIDFECMTEECRTRIGQIINVSGWSAIFCQVEAVHKWMSAINGRYMRTGIWVKPDGAPQFTGDRPGMGYESIVFHWHGERRSCWNGGGKHGVFTFSKSDKGFGHGGMSNEHPTKKPIALIQELTSLFSDKGQTILDPFMGSGTTGVACANLGRKFIGIEIDEKYFDIACERIEAAYAQGRLFA